MEQRRDGEDRHPAGAARRQPSALDGRRATLAARAAG